MQVLIFVQLAGYTIGKFIADNVQRRNEGSLWTGFLRMPALEIFVGLPPLDIKNGAFDATRQADAHSPTVLKGYVLINMLSLNEM